MIKISDRARELLTQFMDEVCAENDLDGQDREDLDEAILDAVDEFEA